LNAENLLKIHQIQVGEASGRGREGRAHLVGSARPHLGSTKAHLALPCAKKRKHTLENSQPLIQCRVVMIETMAPQDSAIISKKNSNVSNISTSIDLSKTNTRDHSYMKFTEQSERDNANDTQPMTQSVMVSNSKYYSFPYPI
jgi:hypothetical protein